MAELPPRYPASPLTLESKSWELRVERYNRTEKKGREEKDKKGRKRRKERI